MIDDQQVSGVLRRIGVFRPITNGVIERNANPRWEGRLTFGRIEVEFVKIGKLLRISTDPLIELKAYSQDQAGDVRSRLAVLASTLQRGRLYGESTIQYEAVIHCEEASSLNEFGVRQALAWAIAWIAVSRDWNNGKSYPEIVLTIANSRNRLDSVLSLLMQS